MYTVIAYKEAIENNIIVRIYADETEKCFIEESDARVYAGYILSKGYPNVDIYPQVPVLAGMLDVIELKRIDALAKLTQEERDILGI